MATPQRMRLTQTGVARSSPTARPHRNGRPYLAWNTPGGDNQVQAMLQAFLALVEFGMNVQQAVEAPTVTSSSFAASKYPQPVGDQPVSCVCA